VEAWNALVQFDYSSAIDSFAQLIRAYPTEVEPYWRLALLLAGERRDDESLNVFNRGLAIDPESGDLWNRLGGLYDGMGRSADAIAARQKYVALRPNEANAHDSLGLSYQAGGRYDDAIASYRRALELSPNFDVAWIHLGHANAQAGRYGAAEEAYRRYIQVAASEQQIARGYESLALLARQQGRTQQAVDLLRQHVKAPFVFSAFVRLDAGEPLDTLLDEFLPPPPVPNRGARPSQRPWLSLQAMVALKRGETAKAIELAQAALRERPLLADADSMEDCLANTYLALGRHDDAITEYERILRRNPQYPLAHYRLGLAYEAKRDRDRARTSFQKFLSVWAGADRDAPEVMNAQARLAALH
jgi:tetratricopeptide (TPR) repeat protein